jgi:alpha-L-fucosidase
MLRKFTLTFALFSALALNTIAQTGPYVPTVDNLAARKKFQDLKFGLFIHWGVYSILGAGEWVMYEKKIPYDSYKRLRRVFQSAGI